VPFFFGAGFLTGAVGLAAVAVEFTVGAAVLAFVEAGLVAAVFVAGAALDVVDEFVVGAAAAVSTIGVTSVVGFGIGLAVTEEI
jgi:hypothetical protein